MQIGYYLVVEKEKVDYFSAMEARLDRICCIVRLGSSTASSSSPAKFLSTAHLKSIVLPLVQLCTDH